MYLKDKTFVLHLRLSEDDYNYICDIADINYCTKAHFVRSLIRQFRLQDEQERIEYEHTKANINN